MFDKYCTDLYDSQKLSIFNNCMNDIYIAWKIAMHKVWRDPWTTYCNLLPHLASVIDHQ